MEILTLQDWLMGRDTEYPADYSKEIEQNALDLIKRVNGLLNDLEIRQITVSSGWRPPEINKSIGGSVKSNHVIGKAVDIVDDKEQSIAKRILENPDLLKKHGLWLEDPDYTKGKRTNWVHLDTKSRSKRSVNKFIP